jgi:putative ABC transport system permease protein
MHYIRAALTNLHRNKVAALINVVGLTLGATCFVLVLVAAEYFSNVGSDFGNFARIYLVQQRNVAPGEDTAAPFSPSASLDLAKYIRVEAPEVEAVARKTGRQPAEITIGDRYLRMPISFADPDFLRIFDFPFIRGDATNALAGPNSAVIVDSVAETIFGSRDAVGEVFTIDQRFDVIVTGVVERQDSVSNTSFEVLVNMAVRDAMQRTGSTSISTGMDRDDWTNLDLNAATFALLPSDSSFSPDELDRRLQTLADRIVPPGRETVSFRVRPLASYSEDMLAAGFGFLGIVPGVSGFRLLLLPGILILAMACLTYINLATAIASTRAKEVGLRKVLGAGTAQITQQHLLEALVAVLVSLALAFLLSALSINAINNLWNLGIRIAILTELSIWPFIALIVLATTLAAGAYPAFVMSRFRAVDALQKGRKRLGPSLLRTLFIGAQFAVASILLTAVMVMYAQNVAVQNNAWRLGSGPYVQLLSSLARANVRPDVFAAELERAPEVMGITGQRNEAWQNPPQSSSYSRSLSDTEIPVSIRDTFISYDYFSTLGVDLVAGRSFLRDLDPIASLPAEEGRGQTGRLGVLVDLEAVRLLGWATPKEAVGQVIYQRSEAGATIRSALAMEIIGVVDRAPLQLFTVGSKANAYHLDPYDTQPIIRLADDAVPSAVAHIRAVWDRLSGYARTDSRDGEVNLVFLDDAFDQRVSVLNGITTSLLSMVLLGFVVALAGIFGMAVFVASWRRHEIGVRKCLGASSKEILRQLLVEFGKPVMIANIAAWPAGYLLAQIYLDLFVERMSFSPWPYLSSLAIALGLACVGVGGQALRAARLQPARILRHE